MTRQQNVQSHKMLYNEVAKTAAEAGVQILIRAIREGIKTPTEIELRNLSQSSNFHQNSFYGFFLQASTKLKEYSNDNKLSHATVISLFPREIRAISDSFHNNTPGLTLNYAVRIEQNLCTRKQKMK